MHKYFMGTFLPRPSSYHVHTHNVQVMHTAEHSYFQYYQYYAYPLPVKVAKLAV